MKDSASRYDVDNQHRTYHSNLQLELLVLQIVRVFLFFAAKAYTYLVNVALGVTNFMCTKECTEDPCMCDDCAEL